MHQVDIALTHHRDYQLTMLSDATAGFGTVKKDAAVNLIWPLFANRVCTVDEWTESMAERRRL